MTIDFRGLADRLLAQCPGLLQQWFPNGRQRGHEFQVGSLKGEAGDSLSINTNTGRWKDFATGESGGDLIDLYAAMHRLPLADAARELGADERRGPVQAPRAPARPRAPERQVIMPAPGPCPSFKHPRYGEPAMVWAYDDLEGRVLGYVARYNPPGERKQIVPWTFGGMPGERHEWGMGQWPEPRPLYGLGRIRSCGQAVLLVEGEKAADAAQATVGNVYAVLTWPGGSQAWRKVDWSPLHGRKILLWPDADEPGVKCMREIGQALLPHCPEVKIIDVAGLEKGWDAADACFTWNEFKAWAVPRASLLQPDEPPTPPATPPPERMTATEVLELNAAAMNGTLYQFGEHTIEADPAGPDNPLVAADAGPRDDIPPVGEAKAKRQRKPKQPPGEILVADHAIGNTVPPGDEPGIQTYGLPDTNPKNGKPLATIENLAEVCRRLSVTIRYNVISKEEEILIPGHGFSLDNGANASLAWLMSWCARFGMPTEKLGDFVTYLADRNQYNPVAEWIESKPWDRKIRLPWLYATIRAAGEDTDPNVKALKETMIRRWLISAVAAAFEPDGVAAGGILVLQGAQYLGKTKWFKSLVPGDLGLTQDGMMLRPDDRDSVKQVCSFWLVELGELDATFRKADIAALKAFITRKHDVLRRAYARKESHYARRTVMFASVNQQEFLADPTGNRRYWTIACEAIDHSHELDMQQVWAEVLELYRAGESWYLEADEVARLNAHNEQFSNVDPIEQRLQDGLDWEEKQVFWRWTTVTALLMELGVDRPTRSDTSTAGITLSKYGVQRKVVHGKAQILVPGVKRTTLPP